MQPRPFLALSIAMIQRRGYYAAASDIHVIAKDIDHVVGCSPNPASKVSSSNNRLLLILWNVALRLDKTLSRSRSCKKSDTDAPSHTQMHAHSYTYTAHTVPPSIILDAVCYKYWSSCGARNRVRMLMACGVAGAEMSPMTVLTMRTMRIMWCR